MIIIAVTAITIQASSFLCLVKKVTFFLFDIFILSGG